MFDRIVCAQSFCWSNETRSCKGRVVNCRAAQFDHQVEESGDDGDDGADGADGADGVDSEDNNNLPSVVAATVGVPPGQDLDALLDTSKSRRGLNSEHEMYLFVFSSVFISNLYFFRVNQREDNQSQSKKE